MNKIFNIAHKGASGYYPENSMIAFEKAIEMGCDGIEADVQLTKDNIPVIFHDEELSYLTNGRGLLKDYTYSELSKLEIIKNKKNHIEPQKIPILDDLLSLIKKHNIFLNLELKNNIIFYKKIENIVYDKLKLFDLTNEVLISSFNHYSLKRFYELSSEIDLGLLYEANLYKPQAYARSLDFEVKALNPAFTTLNIESVKKIKQKNYQVFAYTINEINGFKQMVDCNVDGIITDYPDKLKKFLKIT